MHCPSTCQFSSARARPRLNHSEGVWPASQEFGTRCDAGVLLRRLAQLCRDAARALERGAPDCGTQEAVTTLAVDEIRRLRVRLRMDQAVGSSTRGRS